jgi:hypothetical protein
MAGEVAWRAGRSETLTGKSTGFVVIHVLRRLIAIG